MKKIEDNIKDILSTILKVSKSSWLEKPIVKGAFLDPGEITTVCISNMRQAAMIVWANSFFGYMFKYKKLFDFSFTKLLPLSRI